MVKMLSGIEIFKKILNSSFVCIFKEFPGFFEDLYRFSRNFQAWKLIFSFSRFCRVRGNPASRLDNLACQKTSRNAYGTLV